MDRCSFKSLSPELIFIVCYELDLADLKCLRLTSKAFADIMGSLVMRRLKIWLKKEFVGQIVSNLQYLTQPESAAIRFAREITIRLSGDWFNFIDEGGILEENKIRLFRALSSLKSVQTVKWCSSCTHLHWLHEPIWRALKALPNLRHLTIENLNETFNDLCSLTELETITVKSNNRDRDEQLFSCLAKIYATSPNLISLSVINTTKYKMPKNLHDLFSGSRSPRRLRHLSLVNCSARLDGITLPHLRNLTSLTLAGLPWLDEEGEFLSPADNIWKSLKQSEIHLEQLEVGDNAMVSSLIDYLSTYHGVKKLKLLVDPFDDHESSEAAAVQFWSTAFPNHVETLEQLYLLPSYEGQWCFGSHNQSVVVACTKLKQLRIGILSADIKTQTNESNGIKTLIDLVVAQMPRIEYLDISIGEPREFVAGWFRWTDIMEKDIVRCVTHYRPSLPCKYLPRIGLSCRDKEFQAVRDGNTFQYVEVPPQKPQNRRRTVIRGPEIWAFSPTAI